MTPIQRVVHISVDPERDTPQVMKEHLSYFGVDAIGLTGSNEAIVQVAGKFGARYEKSPTPTAGGYTMAHTVSIFGLDAEGRPGKIIGYDASVDQVLDDVRALLAAS